MRLIFDGQDASGLFGLWVTDGTAAGTYELAPITGAADTAFGLDPVYITAFNSEVLFNGTGANNHHLMWVTDGTAAGTHALNIPNASSGGLDPAYMTVFNVPSEGEVFFNSRVLFQGLDTSGNAGLWMSDGTPPGTHELNGTSGLFPIGMTVFNGVVLFNGIDTSGNHNLWVFSPTLGTQEVTGISGANSSHGLNPQDITVFNGQALFNGLDASGQRGLWVTDGTAPGTHELTVSGANSNVGLNPQQMAVFDGKLLLEGSDTSGNAGFWVSDGTAPGTHELVGISGANSSGLAPTGMTVFNGEVLFNGIDANGHHNLWVTDGTTTGTHELSGGNLDPHELMAFKGKVLFNGLDSSGKRGLWVTDGTGPGTHELNISGASSNVGLDPFDLAILGQAPIWANGVSGDFATASNWSTGAVPGQNDDPEISASGTYTVTSTASRAVSSLTTAAGATLLISAGTFIIRDGTDSGTNAGTILVGTGATLAVAGSVINTGLIEALGGVIILNSPGTDTPQITGTGLFKVGSGGSVNATGDNYIFHGAGGSEQMVGTGNLNQAFSDNGSAFIGFTGNQNQLFGGSATDTLAVIGNNNALVGGAGNDFIFATGSTNTLAGGSGSLTLSAVGSSNFLFAGTGQDWLGASGNQNQLFGGPGTADWMGVTGNNNAIAGGSGNSTTLFAVGSINTLSGGSGNDWIGASGTSNFLFGGSGNDFIGATGSSNTLDPHGAGTDTLYASPNAHDHDTFVYHPGYGNVTIDNFAPAAGDQIAIAGFGFTHVTQFAPYVTTTADGSISLAFSATSRLTLEGIAGGLQDSWFNFHA